MSVNGVLKRVNGGIGQGSNAGRLKRVRSDRGLAVGQTGGCLTGL